MRKIVALFVAVSFAAFACSAAVSAAARQQTGGVKGVAADAAKKPLPNHTIQLREAKTGKLVGTTTTNAAGEYVFSGISPGEYIIEIVDAQGNILGTATVTVSSDRVAVVAVTATALGAAAVAAGAAAGGLAGLLTGTSLLVSAAATAAGITIAVIAAREEASPSR
jgi:hypothetical protein